MARAAVVLASIASSGRKAWPRDWGRSSGSPDTLLRYKPPKRQVTWATFQTVPRTGTLQLVFGVNLIRASLLAGVVLKRCSGQIMKCKDVVRLCFGGRSERGWRGAP
eukprot:2735488-Rhodomonas_salina.1